MCCFRSCDWSSLPRGLLALIAIRLTMIPDYLRFGAVCWSWRSAAAENRHRLPGRLPWLLTGPAVFSQGKRVYGSGDGGWLITLDNSDSLALLNPFTHMEIQLPIIGTPMELYKAVLSSPPTSSSDTDFALMAIDGHRKRLLLYHPVNKAWMPTQNQTGEIADLICHKGHFYAVDFTGRLLICEIDRHYQAKAMEYAPSPEPRQYHSTKRYLVESMEGELLQIVGCNRLYEDIEVGIEVFKHSSSSSSRSQENRWRCVSGLQGQMLLLGRLSSFCLSASHFPSCNGNWIYFRGSYCYPNSRVFIFIYYKRFEFLTFFQQTFGPRFRFLLENDDRRHEGPFRRHICETAYSAWGVSEQGWSKFTSSYHA